MNWLIVLSMVDNRGFDSLRRIDNWQSFGSPTMYNPRYEQCMKLHNFVCRYLLTYKIKVGLFDVIQVVLSRSLVTPSQENLRSFWVFELVLLLHPVHGRFEGPLSTITTACDWLLSAMTSGSLSQRSGWPSDPLPLLLFHWEMRGGRRLPGLREFLRDPTPRSRINIDRGATTPPKVGRRSRNISHASRWPGMRAKLGWGRHGGGFWFGFVCLFLGGSTTISSW